MRLLIILLTLVNLPLFCAEGKLTESDYTEVRILAWDSEFQTNFFILRVKPHSAVLIYESKETSWPADVHLPETNGSDWVAIPKEKIAGFLLGLEVLESGFGSQGTKFYIDVLVFDINAERMERRPFRACDMLVRDLKEIQSSPVLKQRFETRFGMEADRVLRYQDLIRMIKEANK